MHAQPCITKKADTPLHVCTITYNVYIYIYIYIQHTSESSGHTACVHNNTFSQKEQTALRVSVVIVPVHGFQWRAHRPTSKACIQQCIENMKRCCIKPSDDRAITCFTYWYEYAYRADENADQLDMQQLKQKNIKFGSMQSAVQIQYHQKNTLNGRSPT